MPANVALGHPPHPATTRRVPVRLRGLAARGGAHVD